MIVAAAAVAAGKKEEEDESGRNRPLRARSPFRLCTARVLALGAHCRLGGCWRFVGV